MRPALQISLSCLVCGPPLSLPLHPHTLQGPITTLLQCSNHKHVLLCLAFIYLDIEDQTLILTFARPAIYRLGCLASPLLANSYAGGHLVQFGNLK